MKMYDISFVAKESTSQGGAGVVSVWTLMQQSGIMVNMVALFLFFAYLGYNEVSLAHYLEHEVRSKPVMPVVDERVINPNAV